MEEDIFECIMCTKKTIKSDLTKHIKNHHAIEKESTLQKLYEMHFAGVGMETQTNVTWVRSLKNIGDVISRLEDTIEQHDTSRAKGSYESRKTRGSQCTTNFCTESRAPAFEEKLGIGSMAKYIPPPLIIEDSDLSMSLDQILDDAVCVEDYDDDDEPVIIKETRIEFNDSIHLFKNNQQVKKNKEPITALNQIDLHSNSSVPNLSNNFPIISEEIEAIEETQKQEATKSEEDENPENVQRTKISSSEKEETKEEIQENDVSNLKNVETVQDISNQGVSKPEEYDIVEEMQKQEVSDSEKDNTIENVQKQKGSQAEENTIYEEIQNQDISEPEIDEIIETIQKPDISKHKVNDTFEEIQVEEESKKDGDEIIDEIQIEKRTIPDIVLSDIKNDWKPSDATLPKGWLIRDVIDKENAVKTVYLSPCRNEFSSRHDIKNFLKSQGKNIIKTNRLKVFYKANDWNKLRKQTNLYFVDDNDRNIDEIKDELIKDVPKVKTVKQLRYTTSKNVHTRPFILLIDENSKDQRMIIEKTNRKRMVQKRNETWKVCQNSNSLQNNQIPDEKNPSKRRGSNESNELLISEGNTLKEQIPIKQVEPDANHSQLSILSGRGKVNEKTIVEICTLTKPTPESITPQESTPLKEYLQKRTKSKCAKKDINIKTYIQELKDVESKRKSLLTLSILEPEKSKLPAHNSEDAREEDINNISNKPASTRKRKLLTPESQGKPCKTGTLSKDIKPKLISFDLAYNKGKTPSPRNSNSREKRKSLQDAFESNKASNNKKQKKNESLSEEDIKKKNIEKLKRLQQKAVEVNKREGTFVQCGNEKCLLWRLVKEYHDPSNVPDDWVCAMNMDELNNVCGEGEDLELNDSDIVDLKYTCGSLVWGKMKGSPWWPGMVDFCPDSEEYYWLEEETDSSEPSWYHVVFFEGKGQVSRAWIKSADILTMDTPIQIPKCSIKNGSIKTRLMSAVKIAKEAKIMTHEERLDKYSFAALYKGKWGTYSDIDSDEEDAPIKKKKLARKLFNPTKDFLALRALSESPNCMISKTQNRSERKEMVKKSSQEKSENSVSFFLEDKGGMDDIEGSITKSTGQIKGCLKKPNEEQNHIAQEKNQLQDYEKAVNSKQDLENEFCLNKEMEPNSPEANDIEVGDNKNILDTSFDHSYTKIKCDASNIESNTDARKQSLINITTIIDDIKPEELISCSNPNLNRNFPKPPLPSDVLIALAVRNLDPNNYYGAGFSSIIAFLSLHFPYYNRNLEECKEMVRRAYDVNTREETGKENFRIKGALVEQLSSRIRNFVNRSRELVKESLLKPEFLDVLVDRFAHGILPSSASSFRPPYSCKMLSYLALVTLCPPSSLEQITMFITFLFPSLQNDDTAFKSEDYENILHNDENVEEFYLTSTGQTLFVLREGSYPVVLHSVQQFFSVKSNNERLRKSIYSPEVVNILLPNLVATELNDTL